MTAGTTISSQQLRGVGVMVVVVGSFAAFWGLNGMSALVGGWQWIAGLAVGVITLICYITAAALFRASRQQSEDAHQGGTSPMAHPAFRLAVIMEIVAIPVAIRLLIGSGHPDLIISVIAIIVGIHFFMLIPAFGSWFFGWVGAAMVLLGLISLLLPASVDGGVPGQPIGLRMACVGFGCALILWTSIAIVVRATHRRMQLSRTRHG